MKILSSILLILIFYSCSEYSKKTENLPMDEPPPPPPKRWLIDTNMSESYYRTLFKYLSKSKEQNEINTSLYLASLLKDSSFLIKNLQRNESFSYTVFDLGQESTLGAFAFERLFYPKCVFNSKEDKIKFCLKVLMNNNLCHIHEEAGIKLAELTNLKNALQFCNINCSSPNRGTNSK